MHPALRTSLTRATWNLTRAVLPEFATDPCFPWFGQSFDALDADLRLALEQETERSNRLSEKETLGLIGYLESVARDPSQLSPDERDEIRGLMLAAFARIEQMQTTLAARGAQ